MALTEEQQLASDVSRMMRDYGTTLTTVINSVISTSIEELLATDFNDNETRERCFLTARSASTIIATLNNYVAIASSIKKDAALENPRGY